MSHQTGTPIDLTKLKEVSGDDASFIADILRSIIGTLPEQLETIAGHHRTGDWSELARSAHQCISTITYAGSDELLALLKSVEFDAGNPSRHPQLASQLERLGTLGPAVVQELEAAAARFENP